MGAYKRIDRLYCSAIPQRLHLPLINFATNLTCAKREMDDPFCFVLGLPRSGTHTISQIFPPHISLHEPFPFITINTLLRWKKSEISDEIVLKFVENRQKILNKKIECSHFLHYISSILSTNFINSRFILTIREPKSWLYSEVNQNFVINRKPRKTIWRLLEEYRYGRYGYEAEDWDNELVRIGLWPARAYLAYWSEHISFVLKHIPPERLLILDVSQISENITLIENFFSEIALKKDNHKGGQFSKPVDRSFLPDSNVLDRIVREECQDTMSALAKHVETPPDWLKDI